MESLSWERALKFSGATINPSLSSPYGAISLLQSGSSARPGFINLRLCLGAEAGGSCPGAGNASCSTWLELLLPVPFPGVLLVQDELCSVLSGNLEEEEERM